MLFAQRSWLAGVLLLLLTTGCSLGPSRPVTDPATRWVLVLNPRYSAQGTEPEYVWVKENEIPTSLTTVLFGKNAVIAPLHVVSRHAPPPGNGIISPLQGGLYAEANAQQVAVAPAIAPKGRLSARSVSPASLSGGTATPSVPGVTPRGYVLYVDPNRVVIDLSVQHGLKAGDLVKVTREKVPLVHPVTGAYLGELDEEIATAQIVELREKFAIAVIKELAPGAQIRVKDRVVPRP